MDAWNKAEAPWEVLVAKLKRPKVLKLAISRGDKPGKNADEDQAVTLCGGAIIPDGSDDGGWVIQTAKKPTGIKDR